MTTQQAIEKAIEGGFPPSKLRTKITNLNKTGKYPPQIVTSYDIDPLLLMPLFWQCLENALGWKPEKYLVDRLCHGKRIQFYMHKHGERLTPQWKIKWHRLIDHLAEGKDIESFFKNL
jgi:hypothetical protein